MSIEPEVATRLGKLLRLLASPHDGEVLAAANRLTALVRTHDLDWDAALAGSGLTRAEMEGYARGGADVREQVAPSRDWTPADGTSAELGDDRARLAKSLDAAQQAAAAGLLSEWESTFADNMRERVNKYGRSTYVSEKQWAALARLEVKLRRQSFL